MGQLVVKWPGAGEHLCSAALGLLLIFNTVQIVNFAQGQLLMLGAFIGISCAVTHELPVAMAWAITMVAMALGRNRFHGAGVFSIARTSGISGYPDHDRDGHRTGKSRADRMGAVAGVAALPVRGPPVRFAGVVVSMHQIFIFATLAVILLLQFLFLTKTRLGILMQATAQDLHTCAAGRHSRQPHHCGRVRLRGCRCRGSPGCWWRRSSWLSRPWAAVSVCKGSVVSVIGGFGNLPGAVIGGLFLG
mgnify:CR=1 FL=1